MEKEIKKILININSDCKKIDNNTDLINNGLIDSFGFLLLISELENKFKKKINTKRFNTSEFRSIRKIKSILKKK